MTPSIFTTASTAEPACLLSPSQAVAVSGDAAGDSRFVDVISSLLVKNQPSASPSPAMVAGAVPDSVDGQPVASSSLVSGNTASGISADGTLKTNALLQEGGRQMPSTALISLLSVRPLIALMTVNPPVGKGQQLSSKGATSILNDVQTQDEGTDGKTEATPVPAGASDKDTQPDTLMTVLSAGSLAALMTANQPIGSRLPSQGESATSVPSQELEQGTTEKPAETVGSTTDSGKNPNTHPQSPCVGTTVLMAKSGQAMQPGTFSLPASTGSLVAVVAGTPLMRGDKPQRVAESTSILTGVEAPDSGFDEEPAPSLVQGQRAHAPHRIGRHHERVEMETSENADSQSTDDAVDADAGLTDLRAAGTLVVQNVASTLGDLQSTVAAGNVPANSEQVISDRNNSQSSTDSSNNVQPLAAGIAATEVARSKPVASSWVARPKVPLSSTDSALNYSVVDGENTPDAASANRFLGTHRTVSRDVASGQKQVLLDEFFSSTQPEAPRLTDGGSVHSNTLPLNDTPHSKEGADQKALQPDFPRVSERTQLADPIELRPRSESSGNDVTVALQDSLPSVNRRDAQIKGVVVIEPLKSSGGASAQMARSGTEDAVIEGAMKTPNELHTIAGSNENFLPGNGGSTVAGRSEKEPFGIRIGEKLDRSDLNPMFMAHEAGSNRIQKLQTAADTFDIAVSSTVSTQFSVEKLTHQVMDRVVTFKALYQDNMAVMVKPDEHTELRLQFTLKSDGVDVSAQVERGDFNTLRANWGQLQQTLAEHGVRMGELHRPSSNVTDMSQSGNGTAMGQAHERTPRHRPRLDEELSEELAGAGAMTEAVHVRLHNTPRVTPRRWERWA